MLEEIASIKQSNEHYSSTLDGRGDIVKVSQLNLEESKIIYDNIVPVGNKLVNCDQLKDKPNKDDSETIICFKNVSTTWNEV